MTDEAALLASILADPADDTVRLAYADWLDENDQPARAEFICVQVGLARLPGCCPICNSETGHRKDCLYGDRGDTLRRRERELWANRSSIGFPDSLPFVSCLEGYYRGDRPCGYVSRGFVSHVTCTAAAFLGGSECRARGPHHGDTCYGGRVQAANAQFTIDCPTCRGTGRTEGIAAELFRRHPIEWVTLTGVVRGGTVFRDSSGGGGISPDLTPDQWAALGLGRCDSRRPDCAGAGTHAHMSEGEFSSLLVRYGRSLAGLPPLHPTTERGAA